MHYIILYNSKMTYVICKNSIKKQYKHSKQAWSSFNLLFWLFFKLYQVLRKALSKSYSSHKIVLNLDFTYLSIYNHTYVKGCFLLGFGCMTQFLTIKSRWFIFINCIYIVTRFNYTWYILLPYKLSTFLICHTK